MMSSKISDQLRGEYWDDKQVQMDNRLSAELMT